MREPRAMDLLGTHFRKLRQFDQARKYYEDAAAEGYTLSLSNLGVLYMNGEGVQRSPEIAANLFKQGAEKGDANGMFFYAGCLAEGLGLQRDTKGAAEWFRRSARAGNPRADRMVSDQRGALQVDAKLIHLEPGSPHQCLSPQ